jgi:hypothetical protein
MATNKNVCTCEGHTYNAQSLLKIQSRTIKARQITMLITGDK